MQEETRNNKTAPTQPQPISEDVQITELPVDYDSETIIPSIVTVTQPEEKSEVAEKKVEEEIIVVEENELGEVVVKKSKQARKKKEEIVEVIEEENIRNIKKKSIAAHKATKDEEIHEEEITESLEPFEAEEKREILLETPSMLSETVPTRQVSEIYDKPIEAQSIDINVIPLTAIAEEQVLAEEKEQQYSKISPLEFVAKKSFDTNEAYEVREHITQATPSTFESTFQPTFSTATTNLTAAESIVITEVHENEMPSRVDIEKLKEDTASIKYVLQEAASVIETEAITNESELKEKTLPKTSTATEVYRMKEGISVEQNQDLSTLVNFDTEKMVPVTSKVNIDAIEPLVVQEIYTDSKPGKHLPEAFVPTEVANTKFIPQMQIITSETVAPETEGEFIPGRLPPSQTAAIDVTVAEGLLTEQIQTDDKESALQVSIPETTTAISELTLSEGLTISTTDTQMPSKELIIEATKEQRAEIEVLPKQSLTTTTVVHSETDKEYVPGELPQSKTAQAQITCLEIGTVSNVVVQESEQYLPQDTKPVMGVAEQNVKPSIPVEVCEVSTADIPEDFTQYPKYNTQEVTVKFETQDATQIMEIRAEEAEEKYEKTTIKSFVPSSTMTEARQELSVSETKTLESETELPVFELPSQHKGKQTSAHVFPTSTTEIITPEISATQLSVETPESKIVNITQTTLSETTTSQTIAADSLGTYKEIEDIKQIQADVSVTMNETVTVTEVLTDEKVKDSLSKDRPKQCQATVDIDCQKAAHTAEVLSNFMPEQLQPDAPLHGQAKPQEIVAEGIQVLQYQTAEKENEYKADVLPETKHSTYELETPYSELNVTETYIQESECAYTDKEKPKEVSATKNVTTQEVAVKLQTEMVCHADEIQQEEPTTGKAKKYARPLQELIVTEATTVDFHKELPKDIFPYEKKANVDLIPGQQLTVTEVTANESEESLMDASKPAEKYATTSLPTREVAIQEETLSHIKPDELKSMSPVTDIATPHQDVTHHVTQLQLTVAEKESVYEGDVKPESKVINIEFEEGRCITVTEIQTQDNENDLNIPTVPSLVYGKAEFVPCTVAVKEQVAADDTVVNIDLLEPKTTEAQIKHTVLEGLIQTETKVEEKETQFTEILPEARTATDNILLEETVTVLSTVPADKEKMLKTDQLPTFSHASFDVSEQSNIQTTEVHAADTLVLLDDVTVKETFAKTTHDEQYGITLSETTVGESEQMLPKDTIPDKKVAELSIDGIGTATTQEVITDEKENILLEADRPIAKCADKSIDAQPVAEIIETVLENTVGEVTLSDHDTKTANISQSTYESISGSAVTLGETETTFEPLEIVTKTAEISFSEGKSINVVEVTPTDQEQQYIGETKIITQTAVRQLDTVEAIQKQEVPVHESTSDLALKQPTTTFAETDIQPFNAAISSENIPHESETKLEQDVTVNTKKAEVSIREGHVIGTTTTIETGIKESILAKTVIPETKQAAAEIIDLKSVATQFEIFSDTHVTDMRSLPSDSVKANVDNIPHEAVTELLPLVVETESDIPYSKKPDSHKAQIDVESWKGLEISEVTLGDTNEDYKSSTPIDKKVADVGFNSGLNITQTETVLISETSKEFYPKKAEQLTADKTSNELSSLLITENIVQESNTEISGKLPAPSLQAAVLLEPSKPVQSVEEVITQEKEVEIVHLLKDDKKTAYVNFDTHKAAGIEEVTLQTGTEEFIEKHPEENVANVKTSALEYIIEEQPQICEREDEVDLTLKTVSKLADISLQERVPLNISEIHSTENEQILQSFTMPQSAQANKQYLGKEAVSGSEIYTTYALSDITKEKDQEYVANVEQDYLEGVTNIETVLVESEKDSETKFTPESKQATILMTDLSSILVQETFPQDAQQEHPVLQKDIQHVTQNYSPLHSLETIGVISSEDAMDLRIAETTPSSVTVQQTMLDSITLSENIIIEQETKLESQQTIEQKKALTAITEHQSISTSEIVIQEKEDQYAIPKKTEPQLATLNILSQTPLQQYEIVAQTMLNELEVPKHTTNEATPTHSQMEAVEISENLLHEQETKFKSSQPDAKVADIAFFPQKHVSVSEATTETKEANLEKELRDEAMADLSFLPQSAVEVLETASDHVPSDFSYAAPVEVQPTSTTLTHENVVVTDLIVGEKEKVFLQHKTPTAENATTYLSATGKVASTIEVTADIKETSLPSFQVTPENVTVAVLKQEPIEETEINISYSLVKLDTDDKIPKRKAISRQTTLEGVTQTEVAVQEKAQHIDTEYEDSKLADVTVVTNESISITEINFEEQETDKVITGKASEKTAQSQVQNQSAAVVEEIITLQSSDTLNLNKLNNIKVKARETEPDVQYGLVVSEQRSTGELESVPCVQKHDSKKGRVLYEGATTTPLIIEVHPEEKEGKYYIISI